MFSSRVLSEWKLGLLGLNLGVAMGVLMLFGLGGGDHDLFQIRRSKDSSEVYGGPWRSLPLRECFGEMLSEMGGGLSALKNIGPVFFCLFSLFVVRFY